MTKRALKRMTREGAFDAAQFEDDAKVRRLPLARGWSPVAVETEREQGYLKTIKPKSPGQSRGRSPRRHLERRAEWRFSGSGGH